MNQDALELLQQLTGVARQTLQATRTAHNLPIFNEKAENFKSFIRRLNDYLTANLLNDEDARRLLPLTLTGQVRENYEQIPAAVKDGPWQALLNELNKRVCTEDTALLARHELRATRQGGRTIDQFAMVLKDLAQRAYPNADQVGIREEQMLTAFLAGLNEKIRLQVRRQKPESFEKARQAAIMEETLLKLEEEEESTRLHQAISQLSEKVNALGLAQNQPPRNWEKERPRSPGRYPPRGQFRRFNGKNRGRGWNFTNWRNQGHGNQRTGGDARAYDQYPRQGYGQRGRSNRRPDPKINAIFEPAQGKEPERKNKKGGNSIWTNVIFITAIVYLCCTTGVSAETNALGNKVFDCDTARGGILIAPPRPTTCKQNNPKSVLKTDVSLFIQNRSLEERTAYKCIRETFRLCTSGKFWIPTKIVTVESTEAPTKEECQRAQEEREYEGKPLRNIITNVYKTAYPDNFPKTSFWSETCTTGTRFFMERGLITSWNSEVKAFAK
ncbi:hypothetical protein WR25_20101 [Diploscapter pachys]|uniref:Retrotransposon gag domain-containing protein n=1 Tax=Diploscapter pachys TaxID=2018661 RepID=A0A2A2KIR3_9BILA|nr:hypothetical protein WR25_20101 [Diploscapter pachys]